MIDGRKYYCFCEANCKFETMTKEQILDAIAQAAAGGLVFDTEAAFITKVKELNTGSFVTFWVGTTAQYNALASKDANCIYIKTDDTRDEDIAAAFTALQNVSNAQEERMNAFETKLAKKSDVSHTHTTYAAKDHTHDEYVGMVRVIDTAVIDAKEYTTAGEQAKYYHVMVGSAGGNVFTAYPVVVDCAALQRLSGYSSKWYYIPTFDAKYVQLQITLNADGTIKFYLDDKNLGYNILHVAGYK